MSKIENTWAGKRIYRTRPKFMDKSCAKHPFDYSYCIYGYHDRTTIEGECIEFVGITSCKQIVTRPRTSDDLWVLDSTWDDGFWELAPDKH